MTIVGSTPGAATIYGMLAHADRAAAVDEVHARPHPLLQPPRGLLQFAFMTEGNPAADRAAMRALSVRFGVAANLYFPFAWIGYVLAGSGKQTPGGAG